jgi:uncharacterized protein (TIGR02147 family)
MGFDGDFEKLAQTIHPAITAAQAKKSVDLLESLGFIRMEKDGTYQLIDKAITSAPEVISIAIHSYHQQMLDKARKALDELPRNRRNFTGVTLGISTSAFQQVCSEIEQFRARLLDLACNDDKPEEEQCVFHLNLQLFPVSQTIPPRRAL